MTNLPRRSALGLIGASALLGAGCMTTPVPRTRPDGTYCYAIGKWYRRTLTCTEAPVPPEQVEVAAKRFEAAPGMLTVYIIRQRWGDPINVVRLTPDTGSAIVTVPSSFVRLRLKPGPHKLTADWKEGSASLDLDGVAGELLFIELIGSVWAWGSTYRLERGVPAQARSRVARLRLVADVE